MQRYFLLISHTLLLHIITNIHFDKIFYVYTIQYAIYIAIHTKYSVFIVAEFLSVNHMFQNANICLIHCITRGVTRVFGAWSKKQNGAPYFSVYIFLPKEVNPLKTSVVKMNKQKKKNSHFTHILTYKDSYNFQIFAHKDSST